MTYQPAARITRDGGKMMADKYLVVHTNGKKEIHYNSPIQSGEYSLCGHDLCGDDFGGWKEGELTDKKVNCEDCLAIVQYCKTIN